jgi:hypothetical protein
MTSIPPNEPNPFYELVKGYFTLIMIVIVSIAIGYITCWYSYGY